MKKLLKELLEINLILILSFFCNPIIGSKNGKTSISIKGDKWYINNKIINKGSPSEGLLMNVRMVNAVFEDRGNSMPGTPGSFDPGKNTETFISKIPEYLATGVNGFTISLQGGDPGYENAVNSAYESDGSLRMEYMERVARIIRATDEYSGIIILSCFYQRQHIQGFELNGKTAILNAVSNTASWIKRNNFRNVVLEISNEYKHGGYLNWIDGKWLVSNKGQVELIKLAKSIYPIMPVGTSGMGDGFMVDSLAAAEDYLIVHFNNTSLEDYPAKIKEMKKTGKPLLCNEDDKISNAARSALVFSVINGCGWGYMNHRQNQILPFRFEGLKDDSVMYNMMKKITTAGYIIDKSLYRYPYVIITYPKDGDIFTAGQRINIRYSYLFPDTSKKSFVKIFSNKNQIGIGLENRNQYSWLLKEAGIFNLETIIYDKDGNELLRSPKVDIIVHDTTK